MTIRRFVCMAREEVDARRLGQLDFGHVKHTIHGLDGLMNAAAAGRGLVLMVAHYDSLYIALVLLARASKCPINLMSSKVIAHEQLPPAIARHFRLKMQSLSQLLAPGRVVHSEDNLHFFVRALRRGEVVVIAGDVGATSSERSQSVDFLGERRRMASGPPFLAKASGAPLALFSCRESSNGEFNITITAPIRLEDGGLQAAYTALDQLIREQPWRWWAADLYPTYESAGD